MRLYTKEGWLDAKHIEEVADRNGISFIVIIGKRQIGKTYNVLKLMLDENKHFILLRGVKTELDMLKRNVNSPFEKIEGYKKRIAFNSETEYTASIVRTDNENVVDEDGNTSTAELYTNIGMAAALSSIGRIRGFNGDEYSDVVYDEFIPESHLLKVRNGGDAFINMYTTVSGNRELEGRAPLRVWLLANSNNLDNEVLTALQLSDVVEKMSIRGEESRIIKERGIMVILPDSEQITTKRKKTALYRAIDPDSKVAKMTFENEFSYNDFSDVGTKPLQEYNPIIKAGPVTIHLHKSEKIIYITERMRCQCRKNYTESDFDKMRMARDFPELRAAYLRGRITFQSMKVKNDFLHYMDI